MQPYGDVHPPLTKQKYIAHLFHQAPWSHFPAHSLLILSGWPALCQKHPPAPLFEVVRKPALDPIPHAAVAWGASASWHVNRSRKGHISVVLGLHGGEPHTLHHGGVDRKDIAPKTLAVLLVRKQKMQEQSLELALCSASRCCVQPNKSVVWSRVSIIACYVVCLVPRLT